MTLGRWRCRALSPLLLLLLAAPGAAQAPQVDQEMLFSVSERVFERLEAVGFEGLTPPERVFLCVWEVESEVNNGGFHQLYWNTAGDRALEAPNAFAAIGAPHAAQIVARANAVLGPDGPSPDRTTRQRQLESLPDGGASAFEEPDAAFLEYPDPLADLTTEYVHAHRSDFR